MSVFLGLCDSKMDPEIDVSCGYWSNKIGGSPNWFRDRAPLEPLVCKKCSKSLWLILQIYAPISEDRSDERVLYIFSCSDPACSSQRDGWKVLRAGDCLKNSMKLQVKSDNKSEDDIIKEHITSSNSSLLNSSNIWADDIDDWGVEEKQENAQSSALINSDHSTDVKLSETEEIEALLQARDLKLSTIEPKSSKKSKKNSETLSPKHALIKSALPNSFTLEDKKMDVTTCSSLPVALCNLVPYHIFVDEEPQSFKVTPTVHELELIREYEQKEKGGDVSSSTSIPSSENETYESMADNVKHGDVTFAKFLKKISMVPEQILRYSLGGSPLLATKEPELLPPDPLPQCSNCKGERKFEMQLVPPLIYCLEEQLFPKPIVANADQQSTLFPHNNEEERRFIPTDIDWTTILIYTCEKNCQSTNNDNNGYITEFVHVQVDPDSPQSCLKHNL